jgi:small GTP-binding protein
MTEAATGDAQLAFKIILVGESGVGKIALCKRFCDGTFEPETAPTVGLEFGRRTIDLEDTRIKLQIWDTAGQERFHSVTRSYFRASAAVIFVYDVTKRESFGKLGMWVDTAAQLAPPAAVRVLIGNKTDLATQRTVSNAEAEDFAKQHQLEFFETSARSGDRIDEAFLQTAAAVYAKVRAARVELGPSPGGGRPSLPPNVAPIALDPKGGSSCC